MAGTWGPGAAAAPGWARGRRRLRCCSRGAASALAWAPGSAPRSRSQGGCECATADGGAAELRPVRSGRQSFCRPRADLTPLPLSPPAPRLPPLSPCCPPPSFSLYRPPPHALPPPASRVAIILIASLCLACRHVSGATRTLGCRPLCALPAPTFPSSEEERTVAWIRPKGPSPKHPSPGPLERQPRSGRAALGAVRERGAGRGRKTSLWSHLGEA